MKSKNGFTLIELLAVIVILAVIALIATPAVLNMLGTARTAAAKETARNYLTSVELACAKITVDSAAGTAPDWATAAAYAIAASTATYEGTVPTVTAGATPLTFEAATCKAVSATATFTVNSNAFTIAQLNS